MICGIDEAGRGPLAGPVCAAAVILGEGFSRKLGLDDSKKLNAQKREKIRGLILKEAAFWGIGWASHKEIDKINILQASLLAMKRAYANMLKKTSVPLADITVIVDGLYSPDIPSPCQPIVKADAKVPEVMAASILAKCARDEFMSKMALAFPGYGYEKHKGYPTKAHREAIARLGPSQIQRVSFRF